MIVLWKQDEGLAADGARGLEERRDREAPVAGEGLVGVGQQAHLDAARGIHLARHVRGLVAQLAALPFRFRERAHHHAAEHGERADRGPHRVEEQRQVQERDDPRGQQQEDERHREIDAAQRRQARHEDDQQQAAHDERRRLDAYWRAANYLSVGQIYLYDNPLLNYYQNGQERKTWAAYTQFEVHVTDQPVNTNELGVRAVFELGYRGNPVAPLAYSVTLFHHDYEHLRTTETNPGGFITFDSLMEGRSSGIEAWGSWQAAKRSSSGFTVRHPAGL